MKLQLATALTLALTAGTALAAEPLKIVYIAGIAGNPFYSSVACGAQTAAKKLGVAFEAQAPAQFSAQLQLRVLEAVIAGHPDGIMFTATDPSALTPTLLQAKAQGIKILSIDGDVSDMSVAVANIQSDNIEGGAQAGRALAAAIGDKGEVLAISNSPAGSVGPQRMKGFADEIAKHPNITFLGPQYSTNQTAKASSIVTSTIAAHPDLAGVFALTTNNTEGVVAGVREAGMVNKIKVVGFDTSDPIVEAIRKGVVTADVVQYPYNVGEKGLEMLVDALHNKPVTREVNTPFVVATPATIDSADVQKFVYKIKCE